MPIDPLEDGPVVIAGEGSGRAADAIVDVIGALKS
jgi:hypothetical protein